ncbi:GMC family oxidoreductase [Leekyejoonella antrihumi]|uniref:GMC family oxidoreductase n=1 Tax=Leekyejoonella antrihumi TaxID=1660198 RepID=UPI001FEC83BE|nr:GMC family oxidoreductase N-terminal domain-containing protein [Leekyejoonella antrihumi]
MGDQTSDYIIIGAGSSGSVLARRLLDAGHSVHVIEAGPVDSNPNIHSPQGWPALLLSDNDWKVMTTPQHHAADRSLYWPRGKMLGGSSSMNGMIYIRGHRDDYDAWAAAGNTGWGWDAVLPLFKRSEDHEDGASEFHGSGGPLHVSRLQNLHPASQAFVDAAVALGHPLTEDFNAKMMEGVGFNHATIKDGRRHSAWQAFVAPVLENSALTVTTDALVTRLVLDGARAIGVEYVTAAGTQIARAAAEIIVSAGTIGSPKILQLSGIGARDDLDAAGIERRVELPGVGKNLHDHLLVGNIYATGEPLVPGRNNLLEAQLFAHSSQADDDAPDLQPLFLHLPYPTDGGRVPEQGYTIAPGLVAPRSRGTLRVASADPATAPIVDPNILADDYDVEALADAVIMCRQIGGHDAFAPFRPTEYVPETTPVTRDEIRALIRALAGTYHHQVGTCRMGVDDHAVVDPALRVVGVSGLRVVDASIMPTIPRGNTNAPSIMIGEKASDLILSDI